MAFQHPVFLAISCLCAFAFSMKRNGKRAVIFNLCLLPLVVCFALYYSSYHHFGVTVLKQNFIGNNLTVESFVYGMVTGLRAAAVCMWLSCLFRGGVQRPRCCTCSAGSAHGCRCFSQFCCALFRESAREARKINLAQKGIGRGSNQGNVFRRLDQLPADFLHAVTWMISALALESDSMRSRGSLLRGRTAFSIYRFDNRDRAFVIALFSGITLTAMGRSLGRRRCFTIPESSGSHWKT